MPFDAIIGQDRPVALLQKMLRSGIIPHAFIFYGIHGIGKHMTALMFAKALNCATATDDCCDRCVSCDKTARRLHPDVLCIEPPADKKIISISQLRQMQEQIAHRPIEGRWKAVIIDQAHRLQTESANCLLKTLEEPPDNTVLILIADSISAMLPTVLSRCQHIRFYPLRTAEIAAYLCRSAGAAEQHAMQAAAYAQGSIARALLLIDDDFLALRADLAALCGASGGRDAGRAHELAQRLAALHDAGGYALDLVRFWYRDLLLLTAGISDTGLLYNRDIADALRAAAARETSAGLIRKLARIHQLQNNPAANLDTQLGLESVLLEGM